MPVHLDEDEETGETTRERSHDHAAGAGIEITEHRPDCSATFTVRSLARHRGFTSPTSRSVCVRSRFAASDADRTGVGGAIMGHGDADRSHAMLGHRAVGALPARRRVSCRGDAGSPRADRHPRSPTQRVLPRRARRGDGVGGGQRGALAARRADGSARRCADIAQGPDPHPRLADATRQPHRGPGPAMGRRCPGDRTAARGRSRAGGQDDDARVRLQGRDQLVAHRHHAQPVGHVEDTGRLVRRYGGRRGGRAGPPQRRHRRRRIGAHPGRVLRQLRAQAELRPRAGVTRCRRSGRCRTSGRTR